MRVEAPGGRFGQVALSAGPVVFLCAALAVFVWRHQALDPLLYSAIATCIALLTAVLLGELMRRVRAPRELGWLAAGVWLATTSAPTLVASLWPGLTLLGLAAIGLVFGQRLREAPPSIVQLGVSAGAVAALTGFGASMFTTLVLGAVFAQGPAHDGALAARAYQAIDSGLAAGLVNPFFVAAVLATGALGRRIEQFAIAATLAALVTTLVIGVALDHAFAVHLGWTALAAVGAGVAGTLVARRRREVVASFLVLGLVALGALAWADHPVSALLVMAAAGWAHARASGGSPGEHAARNLGGVALVYLVLFASERGLPIELSSAMAGATLSLVRLGLVYVVVRRLTAFWNVPFSEALALPMMVAVGGGWEAVGGMTLGRAPGLLLIEETVALAVGLTWVASRDWGTVASDDARAPTPRAPARIGHALRRRSFSDRWLDAQVADATATLRTLHEQVEDALLSRQVASTDRLHAVRDLIEALVPEDRASAERALRAAHGWHDAATLREDVFDTFLRGAIQIIDPRLVLRVPLEEAFLVATPGDGSLVRLLKVARRARHRTLGAMHRTVRVGRLWRDHVSVALPVAVEAAVRDDFDTITALELSLVDLAVQRARVRSHIDPSEAEAAGTSSFERIGAQLDEATERVLRRLATRVAGLHREFLHRVARDGTLQGFELTARPGDARRAWRSLQRHVATLRDSSAVRWRRVELELHLVRVAAWLAEFRDAALADLARTATLPSEQSAEALRVVLGERINDCARHVPGTEAIRRFERRVATLPGELLVSPRRPQGAGMSSYEVIRLDLRRYVQSEAAREGALTLVEGTRALERALRRARAALPDDPASESPFDTSAALDEVTTQITERFAAIRAGLVGVTSRRVLLRGRASDLQRSSLGRWTRPAARWVREVAIPLLRALTHDLRDELRQRPRAEQRDDLRAFDARLRSATEVPEVYRRLFDPGLLDVAGLFVSRPALEARLLGLLAGEGPRPPRSVLLHGARGAGKTALLQHLLPRVSADALHEIPLRRGQTLAAAVAAGLGVPADTEDAALANVTRWCATRTGRPLVVLDEFELAIERTPDGLARVAAFRALIERTSEQVTWLVVLRTPAARFLDLALGWFDAFDALVEVPPLTPDELERLVMDRHQASGFEFVVRRAPIDTWRGLLQRLPPQRWRGRRALFEALHRRAEGNPELAQRLWLASVEVEEAPPRVSARAVTPPALDASVVLSDDQRAVAATLVLHRALGPVELGRIVRRPAHAVRQDLEYLERVGLAAPSGPGGRHELNPLYALRLIHQLQREHRL